MSPAAPAKHIVIVGGGIIGTCTAYYAAMSPRFDPARGDSITLVEAYHVAGAASGKAGGLLALDWHGQATASLSALSYKLHAELAAKYGGEKWGYRTVDTLAVTTDRTEVTRQASPVKWLPEGTVHHSRALGNHKTTAQVQPYKFTHHMLGLFQQRPGTKLVHATATGYTPPKGNASPGQVTVTTKDGSEQTLSCTHLVLAAGPWTGQVAQQLLPKLTSTNIASITGSRAHSIILRTKEPLTAHALFTDMTLEDGDMAEPEVYPRPDGTVYVCGLSDNEPLPSSSGQVKPDPFSIELLHTQASALSHIFDSSQAETIMEQACYLPISERGRPLVGPVRGMDGVYVASGHSCWGITQGPGTGLVMSEIILDGSAKSADVSKLAP